jgi:hypothetical protein
MTLQMVDLNRAIQDTKAFIHKMVTEDQFRDMDFSYITEDLLRFYALYAQPKDLVKVAFIKSLGLTKSRPSRCSKCGEEEKGATSTPGPELTVYDYYGHHVVLNAGGPGVATYMNDNSSTGIDRPDNACWGNSPWRVSWSQASPPISCPRNSQGYGSLVLGMY